MWSKQNNLRCFKDILLTFVCHVQKRLCNLCFTTRRKNFNGYDRGKDNVYSLYSFCTSARCWYSGSSLTEKIRLFNGNHCDISYIAFRCCALLSENWAAGPMPPPSDLESAVSQTPQIKPSDAFVGKRISRTSCLGKSFLCP